MGKFNTSNSTKKVVSDTTNVAGGASYSRSDFRLEVASVVLSSMINGDSFYEKEADRLKRIEGLLVDNKDAAEFLAKAMVYTRNEGKLRSVSHFMGAVLSENAKGTTFMKSALNKVMIRPDDATELVALWNERNPGKMIPNPLRKAVRMALENRWDAYQLKKYYGTGAVKVSNLINIAHPTPRDEVQRTMFKQALEDKLPNIATAQTVNAGSTGESRAANYAMMLQERKLGYMGALKNIKNILESGASEETIDMLCELLRNERACLNSGVLPFRFTQAFEIVSNMNIDRFVSKKVIRAIEDGFILSARNISIVEPHETVGILLDESGSMGSLYGNISGTQPFTIGKTLMASMLTGLDTDKVVGYLWADHAREISVDGRPFDFIKNTHTRGGGTDVWAAISGLIQSKTKVDKLVIFTDMQIYGVNMYGKGPREFKDMVTEYRKISPNVKVLFWNLKGYAGGTPMKLTHDILEVSGFSDKMLEVIPKMWKDKNALVKEIESIVL